MFASTRFRSILLFAAAVAALTMVPVKAEEVAADAVGWDMERVQPWGEIERQAWPVMAAAGPTCADPTWRAGVELLGSPAQGLFVRSVGHGSPADGQLTVGERIVALNGHRFAADGTAAYEEWVRWVSAEAADSEKPQRWTVLRGDAEAVVELVPVKACHVEIAYVAGNAASILSREGVIMFTPALLDLAPEPWMVQAQVAHVLGHRKGQHEAKNSKTTRWASIAGNVIGALGGPNIGGAAGHGLNFRARPKQEVEADRAGIDLLVGLGVNERDLIQYWFTVLEAQAQSGFAGAWLGGHPAHESRLEALEARYASLAEVAPAAAGGADTASADADS